MQSDRNNFRGDVVLDSVNLTYEDIILDQIHRRKYFGIFIKKILNFKSDSWKSIYKEIQHMHFRIMLSELKSP